MSKTAMLEAMMVALIMMGAATYVATYQPSMRADTSSGPVLEARARNLMEVASPRASTYHRARMQMKR